MLKGLIRTIFFVLIASFVLVGGFCSSDSDDDTRSADAETSEVVTIDNEEEAENEVSEVAATDNTDTSNEETEATTEETAQTENTAKPKKKKAKTYKIGDKLKVGDVRYKVTKVKTAKKVGDTYFNTKAKGTFLIVTIKVTNKGDDALTVDSSFFELHNGEKVYEPSSDAEFYLGDDNLFLEKVNPDLTVKGKIVFDVPKKIAKSKKNELQVQTGYWGTQKGIIKLKK